MLTNEQKESIVKVLNERLGVFQCPMCHKGPFTIIDGYFNMSLQGSLTSYTLGGTTVPMVAIACNNCGFVSLHAIGALGLLESMKEMPNKKKTSQLEENIDKNP